MSVVTESFFITGGTLRHDAPSYVERQADRDLLEGLLQGEFCYVLTSRQMGKSSLMVRTATKLREQDVNVIALDLTAVGQNLTPEQWYDGLLVRIGRQLLLEEELDAFWLAHERLGPCQRLFAAMRDVVMVRRPGPLTVFVDEIDAVRSLPFAIDEFFAAIRECYNRRAEDAEFSRLTFCLLGVATPSDLIRDTRTTPFNIGRRIELHDFSGAEAVPLAQGLNALGGGSGLSAARLLTRILHWTNGHPYLTQRFCRAVADGAAIADMAAVDRLCEELFLSSRARERDDNLLFVRERLLRSEADVTSLLELYLKVRAGKVVADDETSLLATVLRLSGIVISRAGLLRERNRIYSRVFDAEWVQAHLPDADVRRQKAAFQRGVLRATTIAALVVAALTVMMLIALRQTTRARVALAQARFSEAKTRRLSGVAGQRHESLQALIAAREYFTNHAELRDEAIACLALMDLRGDAGKHSSSRFTNVLQVEPDAGVVAVGESDGSVLIRGWKDGQLLGTVPGDGGAIKQAWFGSGGSLVTVEHSAGSNCSFAVWDWRQAKRLFGANHGIHSAALDFSSDGRLLAVGTEDGVARVYSILEGKVVHEINLRLNTGAPRLAEALRFDPSGRLLAECSRDDQHAQVWNLANTQMVARPYHAGVVLDLSWHPGGEWLAAACEDAKVYIWNIHQVDNPYGVRKLSGHDASVTKVAFNHRGTLLASSGQDETLRLWSPASGVQVTWRLDGGRLKDLRFSSDDELLTAVAPEQSAARVWTVYGSEYVSLRAGDRPSAIDFSPDGQLLAAIAADRAVIWDAATGRELGAVKFNHANARSARFSADGQSLLAATEDGLFGTALDWHGDGLARRVIAGAVQRWSNAPNELRMMALDSRRRIAALVHHSEVLIIPLDLGSTSLTRTVPAGVHYRHLAFHPDGEWLAAMAASSNTLDLWKLNGSGNDGSRISIPSSEYFAFSPDGNWLVICHAGKYEFHRLGSGRTAAFPIARKPASTQFAPIAFNASGNLVAMAVSRDVVQLLRLADDGMTAPQVIANLESPDRNPIESLSLSADGRRLAAATQNQNIQLWNLELIRLRLSEMRLGQDWP